MSCYILLCLCLCSCLCLTYVDVDIAVIVIVMQWCPATYSSRTRVLILRTRTRTWTRTLKTRTRTQPLKTWTRTRTPDSDLDSLSMLLLRLVNRILLCKHRLNCDVTWSCATVVAVLCCRVWSFGHNSLTVSESAQATWGSCEGTGCTCNQCSCWACVQQWRHVHATSQSSAV